MSPDQPQAPTSDPTTDPATAPHVEERPARHYAGLRATVEGPDGFAGAVDSGFPALHGWLAERGLTPEGAFIRYLVVDGDTRFEIEMGADVAAPVTGDDRITAGTLPAGRYATLLHVGGFDGLEAARTELLAWAEATGTALDRTDSPGGTAWAAAVERYLVDPSQEPDPSKWRTELSYLTRP